MVVAALGAPGRLHGQRQPARRPSTTCGQSGSGTFVPLLGGQGDF